MARELSREELAQRASEAAAARQFERTQAALGRSFQGRESALDRAIRQSQLDEQIRQFGVGQDWQERQFGELSAAQLAQQAQDQARIDEQIRQFGVGQDWQERQFGELSEAQQQDLAIQQLAAGIDPETNQYLGFDPGDPYAAFSPQQRYQAMQENQQPIVALLPVAAAEAGVDPSVIGGLISTLQTGAMGQPLTDDMVISALAASGDPELQGLIQTLLSLQQEDWRTQVPGSQLPPYLAPLTPEGFTATPAPTKPSMWTIPFTEGYEFRLAPWAYDWTPDWMDGGENAPSAWTDQWGGEAGWNPFKRDWVPDLLDMTRFSPWQ